MPFARCHKGGPQGVSNAAQFKEAISELQDALVKSGISDASIGVRGSSVTGIGYETGAAFNAASDIDVFVESAQLTRGFRTSQNIPGFVHPDKIAKSFDPIAEWAKSWSVKLGRPVSVGGFQPGTVPAGAIIRP